MFGKRPPPSNRHITLTASPVFPAVGSEPFRSSAFANAGAIIRTISRTAMTPRRVRTCPTDANNPIRIKRRCIASLSRWDEYLQCGGRSQVGPGGALLLMAALILILPALPRAGSRPLPRDQAAMMQLHMITHKFKGGDDSETRQRLREIINEFDGTPVAKQAKETLARISN